MNDALRAPELASAKVSEYLGTDDSKISIFG